MAGHCCQCLLGVNVYLLETFFSHGLILIWYTNEYFQQQDSVYGADTHCTTVTH